MTDAVIYAWRAEQGDVWTGEWALDRADKWVPAEANKYILATPEATSASPEVQALVAEAVTAERGFWVKLFNELVDKIEALEAAAIRETKP